MRGKFIREIPKNFFLSLIGDESVHEIALRYKTFIHQQRVVRLLGTMMYM